MPMDGEWRTKCAKLHARISTRVVQYNGTAAAAFTSDAHCSIVFTRREHMLLFRLLLSR